MCVYTYILAAHIIILMYIDWKSSCMTVFQNGTTPLMVAAQEGHLSVVELLVSVGARVNSQNNVSDFACTLYT